MPASDSSTSRRGFIKTSGIVTGSLLAAGVAPRVHAAGSDTIRVGLIGCGGRGTGAASELLTADKGIHLVAMGDLFPDYLERSRSRLAKSFPEQCNVPEEQCFTGFDAFKKVIAADVSAVLLASPPYYRPDHLEAAIAAGKHVFCEKPIAVDSHGVRRVLAASEAADSKGLNLVSGLCWRYDDGLRATIDKVQSGAIGKIVNTQANYLTGPVWVRNRRDGMNDLMYQCYNWYNFSWLSGDHIVEQFVHSLDKAMWLRNDEPPVSCVGLGGRAARDPEGTGDIYDHFHIVYEWADGSRTFANTRQINGCKNEVEDFVFGTDGTAKLIAHQIQGPNSWNFEGDKVQMHQAEQNEFAKALREKRPRINNGKYMSYSTLLAIMGREACYSGSAITWDQAMNSPQQLGPPSLLDDTVGAPEIKVRIPGDYKFPLA